MTRLFAPDGSAIRSDADVKAVTSWFRTFFTRHGVQIADDGYFVEAEAEVVKYLEWRAGRAPFASIQEQLHCVRTVNPFLRVARALRKAYSERSVPGLEQKVQDLRDQPLGLQGAEDSNHTRDTVWELFVGALLMNVDPNLRFEAPDIRLNFRGSDWAIECKFLTSKSLLTHFDRVRRAARQIQNSGADHGLILVNVTSQLDHGALLAEHADGRVLQWQSRQAAEAALRRQVEELRGRWDQRDFGPRLAAGTGARSVSRVRGAALFAESLANIRGALTDLAHTEFYRSKSLLFDEEDLVQAFSAAFNETT